MHSYHKTALVSRLSSSLFSRISCINALAASASSLSVSSSSTRCSLLKRSIAHRTSDSPLPSESEFMPLYCDLNLFLWSLCFFHTYESEPLPVFYDHLLYPSFNRTVSYRNLSYSEMTYPTCFPSG